MKTRITQTDIARVAGVHNTTVSLALRNNPLIPVATRQRIQAIADEMGYYPDPALQALVAYRNGRMPSRRVETLAYVTNWSTRWGWHDIPAHAKFYAGAQRKASQSGYQFEHFWFGESGMTHRRLSSMLFHRGISGAILASHRADGEMFDEADWSRLSVVKIGCYPHCPAWHRVSHDHAGIVRLAVRRVIASGYRRIGLAISHACDDLADQTWSGGFLGEQNRMPLEDRVPLLVFGPSDVTGGAAERTDAAADLRAIERWFRRSQPEVILSVGSLVRTQLEKIGVSVPRDVAYVDLFADGSEPGIAGVREHCERVGEVAAETLINQMRQNIRGVPTIATSTLVDGTWVDGDSLPLDRLGSPWNDTRHSGAHRDDLVAVP